MTPESLGLDLLPPQASEGARQLDYLTVGLLAVTGLFALLIGFLIIYFSIRYRAGSHADRSQPLRHTALLSRPPGS